MKKRLLALLTCTALVLTLLSGCQKKSAINPTETAVAEESTGEDISETTLEEVIENTQTMSGAVLSSGEVQYLERPSLISEEANPLYDPSIIPCIPKYEVAADFSNIINPDEISYAQDSFKEKLAKNLFVVGDENGREFYETYEFNAYSQTPNFVTVDSMMHTYHLYFAHLLKTIEKTYLSDAVKEFTRKAFDECESQYDELIGTKWESAAARNVGFFAVGLKLMGENIDIPSYISSQVNQELAYIRAEDGINESPLTGIFEDYTQYKPRGYYEEDEQLSMYFKTMMWYGRITYVQKDEDMNRSALLLSLVIDNAVSREWNSIYAVTSFFAGASDDLGYCEYMPVIENVYGKVPSCSDLVNNEDRFDSFVAVIKELNPPQIQSIPVYEGDDPVIKGFRLMGQRFTIDGTIMQNLIYSSVAENENQDKRMLPTVLDVPAALGSDTAKQIALDMGASDFPDYEKNITTLRNKLADTSDSIWNASLYSKWLDTLRPLLIEKGDGYPSFMQSEEWTKKAIETYAGSFTELKHDTVLYAKQPMAEMGGGDMDELDDRGYVEPEPLVFAKFASLANATAVGLKQYGMISKEDIDNLGLLTELANKLLVISQKELKCEKLSDDEYELIKNYGGNIEHFWYEAVKSDADSEYLTSEEYPAALVVDVATDPNGAVLEAGLGNPREISVVVPVDGILRIATGSVYNYYEFVWPMDDRLTDSKWREMIGALPGAGYMYERDDSMVNPEWTKSYREDKWNYEDWY